MDIVTVPVSATIRPWPDPIVDRRGHDPRSAYVERYWLGVLGPTATWIMRRFAECFDEHPEGFVLDLDLTAASMGLSFREGLATPFSKALHRCVMFGVAQPTGDGLAVRRKLPSVAQRHLKRMPEDLQLDHEHWSQRTTRVDIHDIERRLIEAGLPPAVAARASEAAALAA